MREVEKGEKIHPDVDPSGDGVNIWLSFIDNTVWWPLKCLSESNLNPGRQTQYPDLKKPVLLHS